MKLAYSFLLISVCLLGANAQSEWKNDLQKAAGVAKVLYQYLNYAANNIDGEGESSRALHDFEEIDDEDEDDSEDDDDEEDSDETEAEDDENANDEEDIKDGERRK